MTTLTWRIGERSKQRAGLGWLHPEAALGAWLKSRHAPKLREEGNTCGAGHQHLPSLKASSGLIMTRLPSWLPSGSHGNNVGPLRTSFYLYALLCALLRAQLPER